MKSDFFKQVPLKPLNIEGIKAGNKTKVVLSLLFKDRGLHALYSPAAEWGASPNKPSYIGARIVRVNSVGNVEVVYKTHASIINDLYNNGVLEVDRETPSPHRRVVLFKLSSQAFAAQRDMNRKLFLEGKTRVFMDDVNDLADTYGLRLEYSPLYGSFRVVRSDGVKICDDEYINTNPRGELVRRLNHMTLLEWDDVLYEFSQKLKMTK